MVFKKIVQSILISSLLTFIFPFAYQASLPKTAIAATATGSSVITLNVTGGITITSTLPDSTMSQTIGVGADNATASTTWVVRTSNVLGYTLSLNATSSPAMKNASSSVPNYTPTVLDTPESWSVASGTYEFGYSAFGPRVPTGTWGTDTDCNGTAINDWSPTLKYLNFATTTPRQIATYNSTTSVSGDSSTVCYSLQQSASYIPSGTYTATITATAVTL